MDYGSEDADSPKEAADEDELMTASFDTFADAAGIPQDKREDARSALEAFVRCCQDYGSDEGGA